MVESAGTGRTLVMTDIRDERGRMWRAVTLTPDGCLTISGHDLGPLVSDVFGDAREYEFERHLTPADTAALRELLEVPPDGDLLSAIDTRFSSTHELETFLADNWLAGKFWSRVGD